MGYRADYENLLEKVVSQEEELLWEGDVYDFILYLP